MGPMYLMGHQGPRAKSRIPREQMALKFMTTGGAEAEKLRLYTFKHTAQNDLKRRIRIWNPNMLDSIQNVEMYQILKNLKIQCLSLIPGSPGPVFTPRTLGGNF